jgi:hypothetical protein
MELTEQQVHHFRTFGYLALPRLLAPDETAWVIEEFETAIRTVGGGDRHDGTRRTMFGGPIERTPKLCTLLDDPRIVGLLSGLLGPDFNYCSGDGNYYTGDTGWHPDGNWGELFAVKLAFYLDPVTRDTGCLRVIPGSHRPGDWFSDALQGQVRQSEETFGVAGRDVPAVALETTPGDLLVFNHNTKHAAFGGNDHRRMFTINLSQRYRDEDLPILREQIGTRARFWLERAYGEKMVRTAGPDRMRHLEQIMANDGHLAELTRRAKETMTEPARG